MLKYQELIDKMTLEQKASLTSGKDFWQSMNIDELGIPSMFLSARNPQTGRGGRPSRVEQEYPFDLLSHGGDHGEHVEPRAR